MEVLFLTFSETFILFSIEAAWIYNPTNSAQGFLFLYILAYTCYLLSFWWQPFWQVWGCISLCFWFDFLWWLVILSIFSCVCMSSLGKCLLRFYAHFLVSFFVFFLMLHCVSPLKNFNINTLSDISFANNFSHLVG